jgi:hypothetical protein
MAPYRTCPVPDALYRTLVWLDFRLAVLVTVGVPLVLLVWTALGRQGALQRLMGIYWKLASLLLIATLLLTDQRPLGFWLAIAAQLIVVFGVWFWVDINEEINDLPPWRALPLSLRIWRWSLTIWGLLGAAFSTTALGCTAKAAMVQPRCAVWLQPPLELHGQIAGVFGFVFGADWTPPLAAFLGYAGLVAYVVGLIQWLLVRLPKLGRVAGGF